MHAAVHVRVHLRVILVHRAQHLRDARGRGRGNATKTRARPPTVPARRTRARDADRAHLGGLLRRRCVVEVHQPRPVDATVEDGEVGPDRLTQRDIGRRGGRCLQSEAVGRMLALTIAIRRLHLRRIATARGSRGPDAHVSHPWNRRHTERARRESRAESACYEALETIVGAPAHLASHAGAMSLSWRNAARRPRRRGREPQGPCRSHSVARRANLDAAAGVRGGEPRRRWSWVLSKRSLSIPVSDRLV